MKILARILAPLTLLEWGGILTYLYFSGRLVSYLHPNFRVLVLVTGILLLLTAVCVTFVGEEEHEHEHEHSHGGLTIGGLLAFLIMLVPMALAVGISPDSYSANLIRNRGVAENVSSLPGIRTVQSPGNETRQRVEQSNQLIAQINQLAEQQKNASPIPDRNNVQKDNLSDLPTQDAAPAANDQPDFVNPALQPNKAGNIKVELTDLFYAAQSEPTRKDFEGKRVELIAQFLPPRKAIGVGAIPMKPGAFKALRMVITCCAADAMGLALTVEGAPKPKQVGNMGWMKIIGRVEYRSVPKPKPPAPDYGDFPEPVIVAQQITAVPPPKEKYLY